MSGLSQDSFLTSNNARFLGRLNGNRNKAGDLLGEIIGRKIN
jgi:hypothetical protein